MISQELLQRVSCASYAWRACAASAHIDGWQFTKDVWSTKTAQFGLLASGKTSRSKGRSLSEDYSLDKETAAALCCLQSVIKYVCRGEWWLHSCDGKQNPTSGGRFALQENNLFSLWWFSVKSELGMDWLKNTFTNNKGSLNGCLNKRHTFIHASYM